MSAGPSSRLPAPEPWQPSLLGAVPTSVDAALATAVRRELTSGAWVDVIPGAVRGGDALFDELHEAVPWQARELPMYGQLVRQPRLSAGTWPGGGVTEWPAQVAEVRAAVEHRYGVAFGSVGANLYRDGRDSVAWHGDRVLREQDQALVAVLSLGATRTFHLRPKGGGPSMRIPMTSGDLLVMGGTCQRTWQHAVLKTAAPVGPRVSLSFRPRDLLRVPGERAAEQHPGR